MYKERKHTVVYLQNIQRRSLWSKVRLKAW